MSARVVELPPGVALVVTDLHGDWPLYARYRDLFLELRARGLAQTLVFTGDLIHGEGQPWEDRSLEIVLDVMRLQEALGPALVVLLGNHELPHLYHFALSRGDTVYTPRFEAALGERRAEVLAFFAERPFYARTPAGVALCHTGAFPRAHDPEALARLWNFSHAAVREQLWSQLPPEARPALRQALEKELGVPYRVVARHYLAISGPEDPRYDEYLFGALVGKQPDFELLWEAFFNTNEREYAAEDYVAHVSALLAGLSQGYAPQRVLVTGHVGCRDGYQVVADGQQLRIASGAHAFPYEAGCYLLFDTTAPVKDARSLTAGLGSVF